MTDTAISSPNTTETKQPQRQGFVPNVISGLATGLFSIPEGMAYAQLAGVNPVYGLYSGIVSTLVASLSTGTVLMMSTLTSAIALATASVLQVSGIQDSQMPQALFTITFLVGTIMFVLGIFRLGSIVNFVSNAVMTGFVAGASLLIILGQEHHLTGYSPVGANQWQKTVNWLQNVSQWDGTTVAVSVAVIIFMVVLKRVRALEKFAPIIVLVVASLVVNFFHIQTELVGSIATIPNSLPMFILPNFSLIPTLALGSVSVALVALAQGAGISTAVPNPDGSKASQSRDFVGEGLGNLAGSFFQSMATGGSLSRTGISVGAGANSRLGGVFAGLWLGLIVLLFGSYAEKVPLAVIGGMLVVVGIELIVARVPSARLVLKTSDWGSIAAMAITFFSALFIPLQFTIFLGALLSLLLYVVASSHKLRVRQAARLDDGGWEMQDAPTELKSHRANILVVQGLDFFAEVPVLEDALPTARGVTGAVVVLIIRDMQHITSTAIRFMERFVEQLQANGSLLILADVNPAVLSALERSGALEAIGAENVIPATNRILAAEETAWEMAQKWLQQKETADQ
ncbi:MAG: SulP family inorganic anion transporter [Ardenticatenaceae bacterium]|nr:SulP family inorganic anion transporter [Ardenticatenaceae bacterium]MCB8987575.1 SulP family inorganic anion transporter [Ardenticatenaceae bacterium]